MCVKISVIVPIYNKMSYLKRSLNSIVGQTYHNIEIILIDDGSTDASKEICLEYCKRDSRFKYYYKENGGVASARNFGLKVATGDYIGFVDPDDYIEKNMYMELIQLADKNNYEIVDCGINVFDNGTITKIANFNPNEMSIDEATCHLLKWDGIVTPYLWNKIFKRNASKKIFFNESLNVGEDLPFIFEYLLDVKRYGHTNDCLYNYVRNEDSLVGFGYKSDAAMNSIRSSAFICKLCEEKYRKYIELSQYSLLLNCYFQMSRILNQKDFKEYQDDFSYFRKIICSNKNNVISIFGNKLLKIKISMCVYTPWLYKQFICAKKNILKR